MDQESQHDCLFKEGSGLVYPLIEIHGREFLDLTSAAGDQLRRGIDLLNQVLQINPHNWAAMWLLGKCYQRMRDNEMALDFFARAHAIKSDQPDIAREASIAAMELRRPLDAVGFCERAIEANPNDSGLRANLALALLFSGQAERAQQVARDALRRNPRDDITLRIAKVCREVLSGTRVCPRHVSDLT